MSAAAHADLDKLRSLTVIPPWSAAIAQGSKPVENRTRNLAGGWRGLVLILSSAGKWDPPAAGFIAAMTGAPPLTRAQCHPGYFIGAADLVDVHRGDGRCCAPWGEPHVWHLRLANALQFAEPIPGTGHLGLRRVTDPALIHACRETGRLAPGGPTWLA
ncbi:hypothetical protein K1T35_48395 (plasmid) [Pseudonocardia sp. DSM 110487]|uniref:hypothetical protein n=1 Tax=Pseudonocardia sp. DSM 110487 TaxID=2865833 RepID=UPI001C6A597A|nr:hypothetical protein [Pseudonocardia sp. DSM 110487]QYN41169.1 hypothetical protein K1T35_48395 [Pseudonocardia sp. DSM 110487]